MRLSRLPALLVLLSCAGPSAAAPAPVPPAPVAPAAPVAPPVDPAFERLIESHLQFLASDDLGGRETGTVQGLVTGQYVAAAMRQAGLAPAGEDGSYFQEYPLETNRLQKEAARLQLLAGESATELTLGEDWALTGFTSAGFDMTAGLVFAGHGLVSAEAGVDEYAGLDVTGRFVVVLEGRPRGRDALRPVSNWRAKRMAAQERGALGLVTIYDEARPEGRDGFQSLLDRIDHPTMAVPPEPDEAPVPWPMVGLSSAAGARVLAAAGLDLAAERAARPPVEGDAEPPPLPPGRALEGLSLHLVAPVISERIDGYNVLGSIAGSDPALAHETVLVTAHMDHVGILDDGRVNNGADDNASGTTTLLVAAALLAERPAPRRTIVFLAVSGEEKGLLGSEWWCKHPTLPLSDVVADINVDMVGRNDPDAVGATPSPVHPDHNTLVQRAVELAPLSGLRITWNAPEAGDDAVDNYYHRSDHYNFAEHGIPVVFFFSGLHEDYHRPTDDVEKIDRAKVAKMVDLVARLATDTANAAGRPHLLQQ